MQFVTLRISVPGILYASSGYIFKNLCFLLSMQVLQHRGSWGDNSNSIVLLDNRKTKLLLVQNDVSFFWRFSLWHLKFKEGQNKKTKNKNKTKKKKKKMKIEAESLYIIQQKINFSKRWYSLKSSVKPFKPYHCH